MPKELKITINSIAIIDEDTKDKQLVETCRTVEDIANYIKESESEALPQKTSLAYWQLKHGKDN